jgi:ribosomal protein L37AE/L43A
MKIVMGVLAVACVVALVMSLTGRSGRQRLQSAATLICTNPQCLQKTEMTLAEIRTVKRARPAHDSDPPIFECPKCKQMTAYGAVICPSCHLAFLPFKARRTASGQWECPGCHAEVKTTAR